MERNHDAELRLDIALTVRKSESETVISGQILQLKLRHGEPGFTPTNWPVKE